MHPSPSPSPRAASTFGMALAWAAAAVAQTAVPPAPGLVLTGLQAALGTSVYVLDALQIAQSTARATPAPAANRDTPRLFASVQDARFDAEGRLLALIVTAPILDPRDPLPRRTLPAAAVRWDAPRQLWALVSPTMQLQELERVGAPSGSRPAAGTWLASQLTQARLAADAVAPAPLGADGKPPEPLAPRFWLATDLQRLATVTLPIPATASGAAPSHRHVVVPWSTVRLTGTGDAMRLGFAATSAVLAAAPTCATLDALPSAALRRRSYAHFAVAPPSWDTGGEDVAPATTTPVK